jgi:GNAT superfamily N-acetyltransferase
MSPLPERLAARGTRFELTVAGPMCLAVVRVADGQRVGEVQLEPAGDVLTVRRLCIEEHHRSYGAGSEAARLLVHAAQRAGYTVLRAWAHPSLGLSVYFWIRMGFSPRHGEGPEGGIWFECALALRGQLR